MSIFSFSSSNIRAQNLCVLTETLIWLTVQSSRLVQQLLHHTVSSKSADSNYYSDGVNKILGRVPFGLNYSKNMHKVKGVARVKNSQVQSAHQLAGGCQVTCCNHVQIAAHLQHLPHIQMWECPIYKKTRRPKVPLIIPPSHRCILRGENQTGYLVQGFFRIDMVF